jgi:ribosome recycling factor
MAMDNRLAPYVEKMGKTLSNMEEEFKTIRAGRANPSVLNKVRVNYYGSPVPVSQVGNVTVPEARILQIAPWEPNMIKEIVKAINMSDIGINPSTDGEVIRLIFPELTEERRKDLTKDVRKKGEEAKVAIRNIRRDGIEKLKKQQKASEITEDDYKQAEKDVQKLTDDYIKELDKICANKEKELTEI